MNTLPSAAHPASVGADDYQYNVSGTVFGLSESPSSGPSYELVVRTQRNEEAPSLATLSTTKANEVLARTWAALVAHDTFVNVSVAEHPLGQTCSLRPPACDGSDLTAEACQPRPDLGYFRVTGPTVVHIGCEDHPAGILLTVRHTFSSFYLPFSNTPVSFSLFLLLYRSTGWAPSAAPATPRTARRPPRPSRSSSASAR